jgi:hypothetical protein
MSFSRKLPPLEDTGVGGKIILKIILKEYNMRV